jgi:hypothetical protein
METRNGRWVQRRGLTIILNAQAENRWAPLEEKIDIKTPIMS